MTTNQTNDMNTKKPPIKPCPRCGSPAGAGKGGNLCQCKKGKQAGSKPTTVVPTTPAPCDITASKSGCGCDNK